MEKGLRAKLTKTELGNTKSLLQNPKWYTEAFSRSTGLQTFVSPIWEMEYNMSQAKLMNGCLIDIS